MNFTKNLKKILNFALNKQYFMVHQVTEGVSVTVETFYQPATQSRQINPEHLFAYRITIENLTAHPVRLISRHWHIFDSNGTHKEVKGDGVVGQQPIITPGNSFQYTSGCSLHTDIGKMHGTYLFENLFNKRKLRVTIPEFMLVVPIKLN